MAAAGITSSSRGHRAVGLGNNQQLDHTAGAAKYINRVRRRDCKYHSCSTLQYGDGCTGTPSKIDGNLAPEFHVLTFKGSCFGEEFPEPRKLVAEGRLTSSSPTMLPSAREHWTNGRSVSGKCLSTGLPFHVRRHAGHFFLHLLTTILPVRAF